MASLNQKPKVIVICGPTGIGKTSTAINLALKFNGEIISADSMQIYKYMDIGTAKSSKKELQEIPHHMLDIINPDQNFDAAIYSSKARNIIKTIIKKSKIPFIVGGTGLYIKALLHGISEAIPSDNKIKEKLKNQVHNKGLNCLYDKLKKIDPDATKKIHANDEYRIIRALEAYEITKTPISKLQNQHSFSDNLFNVLKIGLNIDRKDLYSNINIRCDYMIKNGFIAEVEKLIDMGYVPNIKSMQSIGYKHISDYINKQYTLEKAITLMKQDTRRYAKRQLTWFKKDKEINWYSPEHFDKISLQVKNFLN